MKQLKGVVLREREREIQYRNSKTTKTSEKQAKRKASCTKVETQTQPQPQPQPGFDSYVFLLFFLYVSFTIAFQLCTWKKKYPTSIQSFQISMQMEIACLLSFFYIFSFLKFDWMKNGKNPNSPTYILISWNFKCLS